MKTKTASLMRAVVLVALLVCGFAGGLVVGAHFIASHPISSQSAAAPRLVELDDWTPQIHEASLGGCEGQEDEAQWRIKRVATLRGFDIAPCGTDRVPIDRSGLFVFDTEGPVLLQGIANEYVIREHCKLSDAQTIVQHRQAAIRLFRAGVAIESLELLPDLYLTTVDCFRNGAILDRDDLIDLGQLLNIRLVAANASFAPDDFDSFAAACPCAIHLFVQIKGETRGEFDLTALRRCPRLKSVQFSTLGAVKAPTDVDFLQWWPDLDFFGVASCAGVKAYVRDGKVINEDVFELKRSGDL